MHPLTLSIKNSLVLTSEQKGSKFPKLSTFRTNSQHAYKRSEIIETSDNTGSTTSGVNDSRILSTPRHNPRRKRLSLSDGKNMIERYRYRIDLDTQRNNEKNAAILIQSWWRGEIARKIYKEMLLKYQLKKAAAKAKLAYNEFKTLKDQIKLKSASRIKENSSNNNKTEPHGIKSALKKENIKQIKKSSFQLDLNNRKENKLESIELLTSTKDTESKFIDVKSKKNRILSTKPKNKLLLQISIQKL